MKQVLNRNLFLVKEQIPFMKAAHSCDIVDPATGDVIMECREEKLGFFTKLFRMTEYRRSTPFDIRVTTPAGQPVMRIHRSMPVFASWVRVYDEEEHLIGGFKQKVFSVSGSFDVLDASDRPLCRLHGGLTGWNFRFLAPGDIELARVTKKWAGLGKELLSSADDYALEIDEAVPPDTTLRQVIVASAICISLVIKVELL